MRDFLRKILASKDVKSLLISLTAAVLTACTELISQAVAGSGFGMYLVPIMGAWGVVVNAIQTRMTDWLNPKLPVIPLLLAMLLFPASVFAASPRAIITGPTTATPGEFLTLDATGSENEPKHFKWSISPELKGRKQLLPSDGGGKCVVATYPGVYLITLAISNEDGIDTLTYQITIPGEAPCPPPSPVPTPPQPLPIPPGPVPTPTPLPPVPPVPVPVPIPPVVPPGEFNVAPQVAVIVSKIPSPNRVAEAKQLADAADALAAEIAAGTVTNATVVLTRIGAGIKALNSPAWVVAAPELAALMQATWQAHSKDRLKLTTTGGIVDASGWSTLLREVAIGARGVK